STRPRPRMKAGGSRFRRKRLSRSAILCDLWPSARGGDLTIVGSCAASTLSRRKDNVQKNQGLGTLFLIQRKKGFVARRRAQTWRRADRCRPPVRSRRNRGLQGAQSEFEGADDGGRRLRIVGIEFHHALSLHEVRRRGALSARAGDTRRYRPLA